MMANGQKMRRGKRPGAAAKAAKPAGKGKIKVKDLHKAILQAAEQAGTEFGEVGLVSYLRAQALATPSPFLTLLGKVLAEADERKPPAIRVIELVPAACPAAAPGAERAASAPPAAEAAETKEAEKQPQ